MERRRIVEPVRLFPRYGCVGQIAVVVSRNGVIPRSSELSRIEPLRAIVARRGTGRSAIEICGFFDVQIRIRVLVGGAVVDIEEPLIIAKVAGPETDTLVLVEAISGELVTSA